MKRLILTMTIALSAFAGIVGGTLDLGAVGLDRHLAAADAGRGA